MPRRPSGRQKTMQPDHVDIDRSFFIGQRALELMKTYGSSADPRSYEVWYTYVSGHKPAMNDAIKRITAEQRLAQRCATSTDLTSSTSPRPALRATPKRRARHPRRDRPGHGHDRRGARLDRAIRRVAAGLLERPRRPGGPHADPRNDRDRSCAPRSRSPRRTSSSRRASRRRAARSRRCARRSNACASRPSRTPSPASRNRKHFQDMLHKAVETADAQNDGALARRHRHRPFQALQRPLWPPDRRPGAAPRQHDDARAGEEQGDACPLRRRGIRHHPAGDEPRRDARARRGGHPPSVLNRELVKRSTGESLGKITVSVGVAAFRPGESRQRPSSTGRTSACTSPSARAGTAP